MNHAITYGDEKFARQRHRAAESLAKYCETTLYTEKDIEPHRAEHPKILYPGARGGGFWLYKPLFLLEKVQQIEWNDGLMWMDAGCDLVGDPDILFEIASHHKGFCLFQQNHKNVRFVHKRCFELMDCNEEHYRENYQSDAAVIVLIKTPDTVFFLDEWLGYCSNPEIVCDSDGPEHPLFLDHRHDQSILSLSALKHRIPRFKSPTQFGAQEDLKKFLTFYERAVSSMYSTLFYHHRIRC